SGRQNANQAASSEASATVWLVGEDGRPIPTAVRLGASDDNSTALLEGRLFGGPAGNRGGCQLAETQGLFRPPSGFLDAASSDRWNFETLSLRKDHHSCGIQRVPLDRARRIYCHPRPLWFGKVDPNESLGPSGANGLRRICVGRTRSCKAERRHPRVHQES